MALIARHNRSDLLTLHQTCSTSWLNRTAAVFVFLVTVVAGAEYFGWTDTFQRIVVTSVSIGCLMTSWLVSWCTRENRISFAPDSILVSLRQSVLLAVTTLMLSGLLLVGTRYFPTYDRYIDRDRSQVQQKLSLLVAANNHQAAANVIEQRLTLPISDNLRKVFQRQHVDLLTAAGLAATTISEQEDCWNAASATATQYDIKASEASLRLRLLKRRQSHTQEVSRLTDALGERDNQSQIALKQQQDIWVRKFSDLERHGAMDAFLSILVENQSKLEAEKLHQLQFENLIAWANHTEDLDQRLETLSEAVRLGKQYHLDIRLAESRLAETKTSQLHQPKVLLAGTRAYIAKHNLTTTGVRQLHLYVEGADLQAVTGLKKNDFQLFQEDDIIDDFDIAEIVDIQPLSGETTSVVLLLDESPSTQPVNKEVRQAVLSLVEKSFPQIQFRLMAFASEVHAQSEWTRDIADVQKVVQTGMGGKATALRRSILAAVEQLQSRTGRRILVVFTDGADNTSQGLSDQQLIDFCTSEQVQVFSVDLETNGLDERLLKALADSTGGMYLKAQNAHELTAHFQTLERQFSQKVYQVRIYPSKISQGPLTLRIGRGDSALELLVKNNPLQGKTASK